MHESNNESEHDDNEAKDYDSNEDDDIPVENDLKDGFFNLREM